MKKKIDIYEFESKNINIDSKVLNKIMKMHRHYDYIFASSDYCIGPFSEAFGYDKKYFRVYPLPRLDNIINKNNISFLDWNNLMVKSKRSAGKVITFKEKEYIVCSNS